MQSLIAKASLFTKTNFPPILIVLASVCTSFINFLINLCIFFIIAVLLKVQFSVHALLLILYLAEIFALTLGLSLILCAYYPKFRDLQHIWNLVLLIGFWITPIIYRETSIPFQYLKFYMLNPLARIINEARDILIFNYLPEGKQIFITLAIVSTIFIFGMLIFYQNQESFAEEL